MDDRTTDQCLDQVVDDCPAYHERKVPWDRALAALLLVPAVPIIAVLAMLVRLTSAGPGIYRQRRAGLHGRSFEVFKVRTMYQDAEANGGPQWCARGDNRVTPLGRLLRFIHLDELPQLWNVVRGDMVLVGPRPERCEFIDDLAADVHGYRRRLCVRPGVTGLAQINLEADRSLRCVFKKTLVDLQYVDQASWALDLRILACTLLRMCFVRHGRAARWLRVECDLPKLEKLADQFEAELIGAERRGGKIRKSRFPASVRPAESRHSELVLAGAADSADFMESSRRPR